jgi:hypothetical protein
MNIEGRKEKKPGLETLVNIRKVEESWKQAIEQERGNEQLKRILERLKEILYTIGSTSIISSLIFVEKAVAQQQQPPSDAHGLLTLLTVGGFVSLISGLGMYVHRFARGGEFPLPPEPPPIPVPQQGLLDAIARLPVPSQGVDIPHDYLVVRNRLQQMNPNNFSNPHVFIEFVRETKQLVESIIQGPGATRTEISANAEDFLTAVNVQLELIARELRLYDAQIDNYVRQLEQNRREGIWLRREYRDLTRRLTVLGLSTLLFSYIASPLWNFISQSASNISKLFGVPVRIERVETQRAVEEAIREIEIERRKTEKEMEKVETKTKLSEAEAKLKTKEILAFQIELKRLEGEINSIEKAQGREKMELIRDLQGIIQENFELMSKIAGSKLSNNDKKYLIGQVKQNSEKAQHLIDKLLLK